MVYNNSLDDLVTDIDDAFTAEESLILDDIDYSETKSELQRYAKKHTDFEFGFYN